MARARDTDVQDRLHARAGERGLGGEGRIDRAEPACEPACARNLDELLGGRCDEQDHGRRIGGRRAALRFGMHVPQTHTVEEDPMSELYGPETRKAIANFPVSGRGIPVRLVHWLGRIKAAAARVNADLGLLDRDLAERIAHAGDAVARGEHDDQFPIDVFQTGSGTSSNMNANEVIATLAGDGVHPNDHVNLGQRSNDVFPSAVHLAALDLATHDLLPGARAAARVARRQGVGVRRRRQGRPHAPDGRGAGHARPGVRRLHGADRARPRARRGHARRASARSRSAAPPPAPA